MKTGCFMLFPLWFGVVKVEHGIAFGLSCFPFRPQLQVFVSWCCFVPVLTVKLSKVSK